MMLPEEIEKKYGDLPYLTPYQAIYALTDEEGHVVELHEFHARGKAGGGAAWEVYHFPRTSPLILEARREGPRNIFLCRAGVCELDLIPGLAGAGLERVNVLEDRVELTYARLGRATLFLPRLRKLTVGVDDTDDEARGATWAAVNESAWHTEREGLAVYLSHSIVQLFPQNPYRTTNCCSTAVMLGVEEKKAEEAVGSLLDGVRERTYSEEAAAAILRRMRPPLELQRFTRAAKSRMVEEEEAENLASWVGVELREITGSRGRIGALAALGMGDRPDEAVRPYA